jgi:hypothetical protein
MERRQAIETLYQAPAIHPFTPEIGRLARRIHGEQMWYNLLIRGIGQVRLAPLKNKFYCQLSYARIHGGAIDHAKRG